MNLDLDETQTLLRATVRAYLEREIPFDRVREVEKVQGWDGAAWQDLCAQGWLAVPFGEAFGGSGSPVDAGLLVEEIARRALAVPIAEVFNAARAIELHASETLASELLPAVLAGERRIVPAVPADSDQPENSRVRVNARSELTGEVAFVDYASAATDLLVTTVAGDDTEVHLVSTAGPGVRLQPLRSIGRTPLARVRFDAAPGRRIGGVAVHTGMRRLGRALAGVQCLGSMQQALEMTLDYARMREQFGRAIGTFQAVQHHCANMASRIASVRHLVYEALDAIGNGSESETRVAVAKAAASRATPDVTMLAHQIHGGNGVIEENDLYFFTLRGKEASLAWGSLEQCLAVISADVDRPEEWV